MINLSTAKMCAMFPRSLYLGVEEHIRDKVSLNCHRVAKDCFMEVVRRWLSNEDGTVWFCEVNKMFMSFSQLTTGNSLHQHRLELMKHVFQWTCRPNIILVCWNGQHVTEPVIWW